MTKNPYEILGVSRDADAAQIKSAYRKLSKEWHPDKHKGEKQAEDKFKEINQAYELLSDPKKRQMYDQFGSADGPGGGFGGAGGFGGFDNMDFSQFQGDMGDLGDLFNTFFSGGAARGGGRRQQGRGADIEMAVDLTLEEAFSGIERSMNLRKLMPCDTCDGSGAAKDSKIITCETCSGTGQVTRVAQSFFGQVRQSVVCTDCGGGGKKPESPCNDCSGEGRRAQDADVTVGIPAGIHEGQTVKIPGQGEAGVRGESAGDLYVHVSIKAHSTLKREQDDIVSELTLSVIDVLLGTEKEIATLHGDVTLKIPEGTQPGQIFRLRSKGMAVLNTGRFGDHYVQVTVEIPKKLSRKERKLVEEWKEMQ